MVCYLSKLLEHKNDDSCKFLESSCVCVWELRILHNEEGGLAAGREKGNMRSEGENIGIRENDGEMGEINEIIFIY